MAVVVLLCWFYGVLAQQLPDCLLQQGLPGSNEGRAMTAARLRLASMLVAVARWSTDLDAIFIISSVRCTTMIKDEYIGSFSRKKKVGASDCARYIWSWAASD